MALDPPHLCGQVLVCTTQYPKYPCPQLLCFLDPIWSPLVGVTEKHYRWVIRPRYLISYVHGDFAYYENGENITLAELPEDFRPCVFAMHEGWASSFLMSVETQHTIGWDTVSLSHLMPPIQVWVPRHLCPL